MSMRVVLSENVLEMVMVSRGLRSPPSAASPMLSALVYAPGWPSQAIISLGDACLRVDELDDVSVLNELVPCAPQARLSSPVPPPAQRKPRTSTPNLGRLENRLERLEVDSLPDGDLGNSSDDVGALASPPVHPYSHWIHRAYAIEEFLDLALCVRERDRVAVAGGDRGRERFPGAGRGRGEEGSEVVQGRVEGDVVADGSAAEERVRSALEPRQVQACLWRVYLSNDADSAMPCAWGVLRRWVCSGWSRGLSRGPAKWRRKRSRGLSHEVPLALAHRE